MAGKAGIKGLFYITHVENIPSILQAWDSLARADRGPERPLYAHL